jgi:hypothetical protein
MAQRVDGSRAIVAGIAGVTVVLARWRSAVVCRAFREVAGRPTRSLA